MIRAVARPRSPHVGWRWQERSDEGPLPVRETNPAHASRLIHPASVSELALVIQQIFGSTFG